MKAFAKKVGAEATTLADVKTATEDAASKKELGENAVIGESGVSLGRQWDLLGDSSVTSLDASKPSAAIGVQYGSAWSLLRVLLRKNLADDSVSGAPGSSVFGNSVLDPGLSNVSLAFRAEHALYSPAIACTQYPCSSEPKDVIVRWGLRVYGEVAAALVTYKVQPAAGDHAIPDRRGVPLATSIGLAYKVDGVMPSGAQFGSNKLMVEPYLGAALHALGGDFGDTQRKQMWNSDSSIFLGGELGTFLQFGSLLFDTRLTLLTAPTKHDYRVAGLSGLQFQARLTFVLPWSIVKTTDDQAKKPE